MNEVVLESKMSITRYLFEELDEEIVKASIHQKLVDTIEIDFIFYETAVRFGYHLTHIPEVLIENATKFIHPLIKYFKKEFLTPLNQRAD